jgi:hypothetical protein
VAAADFAFALSLSGYAHDSEMLIDVLKMVLGHAGYSGDTLERLVKQVSAVRPDGKPCAVRFEAQGGELQIVVSQAGRDWRTTCPLLLH